MKKIKISIVLVSLFCLLSSYFQTANAASFSKSMTKKLSSSSSATAILNTTSGTCPFFPNPVSPSVSVLAVFPTGSVIGSATAVLSGLESNPQYVPILESNPQYVPKVAADYFPAGTELTAFNLDFSNLPAGDYVMTIKMTSGAIYTTKFTVAS